MDDPIKNKIVLEIETEEVRVMIGILMLYHFDHPCNHKVAAIIDQVIDQFDRSLTQNAIL